MKARITTVALLLSFMSLRVVAQAPLVYSAENTGASCAAPPLPSFSQLPAIEPLPDPFMWADGRGRSTSFSDWECRRNEIKAQIENYEIGKRPARPQNITASYAPGTTAGSGTLTVNVMVNGKTLTLTSQVSLPAGAGPFPAIIGMNSPSGSVPATVFTSRNIARITYNHNQVTTYASGNTGPSLNDPYYQLYPDQDLTNSGQYAAWSWGVSRIIDGLELVQASLPIDLRHLGVTGCSYAGKMALFSGAMDERIALTIAQESGGGGAPAWRVSETLGAVEKLGATDYRWFKDDMMQFAGTNVAKLPEDHHELMAMIAPRALLVTGNTDFEWLANPAAYVSARAAHEVWKQFGIGDHFGFYIDGGHGHCAVPAAQQPAMEAFVDKFLLGNTSVNTNITVNPYPTLNYQRWYQWWGTGNAVLPPLPPEPLGKRFWLETECATVGADWSVVADTAAAGGAYVQLKPGLSSPNAAPTAATALLTMPFTIDSAGTYNLRARLKVPVGGDYGYWLKIDGGAYQSVGSQLATNPGFENGITGWTTVNGGGATISANAVATDAHSGTGSLKVVNPTARPGNQWQVQVTSAAFPTTIGKQYTISYWVRAAAAGGSIRLSTGPSSPQYQADQAIGTAWQQVTWTITAGVASTTFLFDMGQVANTYYIDDVSVKEVNTNTTASWQWVRLGDFPLSVGAHTLTIGYNAGGNTGLDKLLITSYPLAITGKGAAGSNCGAPLTMSPSTGPVGTSVTITGTNLTGATAVIFNGTAASSFVVNSATSLTAIVAAGTTTGPVTVTMPSSAASSAIPFVVRVAPTTVADAYTTPPGVRLTGNVLTNDLGTNPMAILIIRPTHGTLMLNPDGSFSYQPAAGYVGSDSFIYYACDPGMPLLCGNPVTVSLTVQRVAPTTVPDAYTTPQGVTLTGNVLTNDLGTNPRAILIIRPTHGTLMLNPNGSFSYQPAAGYVGADSFMYYACDPGLPLLCGNPATVSLTVVPATSARAANAAKPDATAKPGADAPAMGTLELALTGSPNPFGEQLRLRFALPTAQAYTLAVYDAQGRLVQQLASGQAEAGQAQELVVPTHAYAAGLYLVRLTMASGTQQLKLLKLP